MRSTWQLRSQGDLERLGPDEQKQLMMSAATLLQGAVFVHSIRFEHPAYEHEREVRAVVVANQLGGVQPFKARHRVRGTEIARYLLLCLRLLSCRLPATILLDRCL